MQGEPACVSVSEESSRKQPTETENGRDLTKTVAKHYNELKEEGLQVRGTSRIFYLRNFNNWIKSVLIGDILQQKKKDNSHDKSLTILDLCCGKGGDLLKWKKGQVDKIVCADIAATSVEQCESRYKEMLQRSERDRYPQKVFSAEFIVADCTKTRLRDQYKDPSIQFNIVSCQFSFHYCFESYTQAEMMLKNACECLAPGGYFIGTTPDSYELIRRLRESPEKSFGNEVYRVTFHDNNEESLPLFGATYDFHLEGVVDCPEFLVYFPVLEKMAEKYGMKLIKRRSFADYFKDNIEAGEARSLIGRMQALETYPPDENATLMSSQPNNYEHAVKFLENLSQDTSQDRRHPPKIGTLSQDEWEAATIYCVFVFKKVAGLAESERELPSAPKRKHDDERTSDKEEPVEKIPKVGE
ncbi:mRNA cap guanine-N7 methyltransferase-like [Gigantopelta aegis]|uniref:mRNA cap guanine-N7 methyltransferase-like n=1 Tax=Gigantopelta aegis TaxID=1735272 RepID=UPI001B88E53B|nr:mRNA cap guanine-N7 methyltransferase-like [Gigantopelta aegis]